MLLTLGAYVYEIMDYGTPGEFSKEAWPKTKKQLNKQLLIILKQKQISSTVNTLEDYRVKDTSKN
ncbi:hypothetical protein [Bacillus paramobilis]|uniref:hypothetical protein n=1 Tax=Bacillus paramobilis TaxID=2817477 RepID=UPI00317D2E7A